MGYWLYPKHEFRDGEKFVRYNAAGWDWLCWKLEEWGMAKDRVNKVYDACWKEIPEDICKQVADLLEANLSTLPPEYVETFSPQVERWRWCGGFRVEG